MADSEVNKAPEAPEALEAPKLPAKAEDIPAGSVTEREDEAKDEAPERESAAAREMRLGYNDRGVPTDSHPRRGGN